MHDGCKGRDKVVERKKPATTTFRAACGEVALANKTEVIKLPQ